MGVGLSALTMRGRRRGQRLLYCKYKRIDYVKFSNCGEEDLVAIYIYIYIYIFTAITIER
jgi:hypothetical protein